MLDILYPFALALLPLPLLLYRILPAHHEPRPALRVPFLSEVARLTGANSEEGAASRGRRWWRWAVLAIAWVALVAAAARPQWLEDPVVRDLPMRDLLLAVDLSGSMQTEDFTDQQGNTTDRLTAVKQVVDEFLVRREGDRVGLIFFGTAAFVQAPFTDDLEVIRELLGEARVSMAGPRTAMGDAIGLGITLFERSETEQRVMILLTDGNDTGSLVPPRNAASIARDEGVVIHAVAVGDPENAGEQALDEETLRDVAETTGGGYFRALDRESLAGIYAQLDALNPRLVETVSYRPRTDLYHWPMAFAVLLSLLHAATLAIASRRTARLSSDSSEIPA